MNVIYIPHDEIIEEDLLGRQEREVKQFAQMLMNDGKIHVPILAREYDKKYKVIDGRKRVLAIQWIQENVSDPDVLEKFNTIPAVLENDAGPLDRAKIGARANEARSDNILSLYYQFKEVQEREGEKAAKDLADSESRYEKVMRLDDLYERDYVFQVYAEERIANGTLDKLSKSSKAIQENAVNQMKAEPEEKFTGSDLRELKSAGSNKILSGLDLDVKPDAGGILYVYVNGESVSQVYHGFQEAAGADEKGTLYKLQRVGGKI